MNFIGNRCFGAMILTLFATGVLADERFFMAKGQTLHVQTSSTVYGHRGEETIKIENASAVTLDGNIEHLELPLALTGYLFSIEGSVISMAGDDGSQLRVIGLNQSMSIVFEDQTLDLTLTALGAATLGEYSLPAVPGRLGDATANSYPPPEFSFLPDDGVRIACAAVPRIGFDESSQVYYLYHANFLNSNSGTEYATSPDGLSFGDAQEAETKISDNGEDMPPLLNNKTAFSPIIKLPESSVSPECGTVNYRLYTSNGNLGNGMGDGIVSSCSEDGVWFLQESGNKMVSPDGGNVGVATAFALDGRVHLLTMDGKSPNDAQEYRHRVWHYQSLDGKGESFELVSDDPLNNGPTVNPEDRQNDPLALAMTDGSYVILTMKQHNGPISPSTVRTGEIYGWQITPDHPDSVDALTPKGESEPGAPLIDVDDFAAAGHDVYSINDPSMYRMSDGSYRMYVGALLKVSSYPDVAALADCGAAYPGDQNEKYAWAILSATSAGTSQ